MSTCTDVSSEISALRTAIARLHLLSEADVRRIVESIVESKVAPLATEISYKIDDGQANRIVDSKVTPLSAQLSGQINSAKVELHEDINRAMQRAIAETLDKIKGDIAVLNRGIIKAQGTADTAHTKATNAENKIKQVEGLANEAKTASGVAQSEATSAGVQAATAARDALNASTEVSGLKGIVEGIKGKIGELGNAIVKVEQVAGDAFKKAANAIGISNEALAATGRILGKIAEIFQIIGTLATLIEQLATLNTLGGRIDAVERGLEALGASVSGILGKLLGLQNRIARNEATIGEVRGIADNARGIGEGAQRLAGQAQVTATRAQATSESATGKAVAAQTTANGAVRNAAQANENAKTAYQKAVEATLTANHATTTANVATTKANIATTTANTAKEKAGEAFQKALEALGVALTALSLYQGFKALRGLQGIPGRDGRNGRNGIDGRPGRDGVTTVVQIPGVPGKQGERGFPGISGLPGRSGRDGRNGIDGKPGRDGIDMNPADLAGLKAFIAAQHAQTRALSTTLHSATRTYVLTPIMAALVPILALLKQIYDIVAAASNAAQLALLNIINNKLGPLLPEGLSGTFGRLWQTLQIDRILNILILITTFHNALMLSNNLAQTLFSAIDNISQAVGFKWKNEKGEDTGFGSIISEWTADFFKAIFGEENYTELVANYKKANRIYQATANIFNALQSIGYSILSALEVVGSYVALIGNALRKWGEVGESAYRWFNPQPNFHNKFFTTIEGATNVISQVDQVASEVISIEDNVNQIGQLKNELNKSLSEESESKQGTIPPEAAKVKDTAEKSKSVSATGLQLQDIDFEPDDGD